MLTKRGHRYLFWPKYWPESTLTHFVFSIARNRACHLTAITGTTSLVKSLQIIVRSIFRWVAVTSLKDRAPGVFPVHYSDVIMGTIASQITSLTIVYSTFIQRQIKENIKAPLHRPLCGEFTVDQWIPRTNGQWRRKFFYLMTSSWISAMDGMLHFTATHLITPLIDDGHVDVIYEDNHPSSPRGPICTTHTLVHVTLNGLLQEIKRHESNLRQQTWL